MTLSEEHAEMLEQFKRALHDEMRRHEQDFHDLEAERLWYAGGAPVSSAQLVREHVTMKDNLTEIADTLLGTPRSYLAGGGREEDGIEHTVRANTELLSELKQGVRLKLPPAVWSALILALGGIVGALIGAWVQLREIAAAAGMG